jgi:hypothetical protein
VATAGNANGFYSYYLTFAGHGLPGKPYSVGISGAGYEATGWDYDFGDITLGSVSDAAIVSIHNNGTLPMEFYLFAKTNNVLVNPSVPIDAIVDPETYSHSLNLLPGESHETIFQFKPGVLGNNWGSLTFIDRTASSPSAYKEVLRVVFSGKGVGQANGNMQPSATYLPFSNVVVGNSIRQAITITNNTNISVFTLASVTSVDGAFSVVGRTCGFAPLVEGSTCTVTVQFMPQTVGAKSGSLVFSFGGVTPAITIPLTGVAE